MLPCPPKNTHAYGGGHHAPGRGHHLPKEGSGDHRRRLLSDHFRILAADSPAGTCKTVTDPNLAWDCSGVAVVYIH